MEVNTHWGHFCLFGTVRFITVICVEISRIQCYNEKNTVESRTGWTVVFCGEDRSMDNSIRAKIFKSKRLMALGFALTLLLFVTIVILCIVRGFSGMEATWVFNIGTDVVSIAVCAVVYFGCMMDSNGPSENTALFNTLVLVNTFALFFDAVCWLVQGLAPFAFWNRLANALLYANGSVVIYLFWRYVTSTLGIDSRKLRVLKKLLNTLLLPDVLLKLANTFWPIYFVVDAAGVYRRGTFFGLSYLYLGVVMLTCIVELVGSRASFRQKIVAVSFITIPILNQLLIGRAFGLSTQYSSTLLSIVLIYSVLFADRGKSLAATEKELNTAADIQAGSLPSVFPAFPEHIEFDIYASMDPAREVGGDFYDFFLLDEDRLCLLIADVSGKGIPAALFMMSAKILLQSYAMAGFSPAAILQKANERICANNKEEMFVTVWLGILDLRTGMLTAANAGHEYPVLHRKGQPFELLKDKHGFVLGGMENVKYREYALQLEAGDEIFLYTDGVPEANDPNNALYGTERMLQALNRSDAEDLKGLLAAVRQDVDGFVGGAEQFDDLTMLCLRFLGNAS